MILLLNTSGNVSLGHQNKFVQRGYNATPEQKCHHRGCQKQAALQREHPGAVVPKNWWHQCLHDSPKPGNASLHRSSNGCLSAVGYQAQQVFAMNGVSGGLLGGEWELKSVCMYNLPETLSFSKPMRQGGSRGKKRVNEVHFKRKQQWPGRTWTLSSKAEGPTEEKNHECPTPLSELTVGVIFKVKSMPTVQRYKLENGRGIHKRRKVMKRDSRKSNSTENSNPQSSSAVQPAK